jgi:hypothetical protein
VIAFALGSIVLALGLGYAISWSLIGPVKKIETQLNQVAAGPRIVDLPKEVVPPKADKMIR